MDDIVESYANIKGLIGHFEDHNFDVAPNEWSPFVALCVCGPVLVWMRNVDYQRGCDLRSPVFLRLSHQETPSLIQPYERILQRVPSAALA
jgi:hypothetical protein